MTARRYHERTHRLWVGSVTPFHDPHGPEGSFRLDAQGRIHARWPVGIYVAVDATGTALYVGQICRDSWEALKDRLVAHHQPVATWHRVWLLPLRADTPPEVVARVEAMMIRWLNPSDNRQFPVPRFTRSYARAAA